MMGCLSLPIHKIIKVLQNMRTDPEKYPFARAGSEGCDWGWRFWDLEGFFLDATFFLRAFVERFEFLCAVCMIGTSSSVLDSLTNVKLHE